MKRKEFFQKGQVTVLVLLLGVLGLTLGLSMVSRSLSDLKQASFVDFGTKTLAAAETGVEYGLAQVNTTGFDSQYNKSTMCDMTGLFSLTPTPPPTFQQIYDVNRSSSDNKISQLDTQIGIRSLYYSICKDELGYGYYPNTTQDSTVQVDLPITYNWNSNLNVSWSNSNAAVEVSVLYFNSSTNAYTVKRYAINGGSVSTSNNFSPKGTCSSTCGAPALANCSGSISGTNGGNAIQVRVRPIYGNSDIAVCSETNSVIPPQFYTIVSKATSTNGTVRRVSVTRNINGWLPSMFDSVIFSGGSLTK